MLEFGPYGAFIYGSYAVTALVLLALVVWLVADERQLRKTLKRFETEGLTRRHRRRSSSAERADIDNTAAKTGSAFNGQKKRSNA